MVFVILFQMDIYELILLPAIIAGNKRSRQ